MFLGQILYCHRVSLYLRAKTDRSVFLTLGDTALDKHSIFLVNDRLAATEIEITAGLIGNTDYNPGQNVWDTFSFFHRLDNVGFQESGMCHK